MRIVFLSYDFGEYSIKHASALAEAHEVRLMMPAKLARSHRASSIRASISTLSKNLAYGSRSGRQSAFGDCCTTSATSTPT